MLIVCCLLLCLQDGLAASSGFAAQHRLGEAYIEKKNYRAAIPFLREAYRLNPVDYGNAFDLAYAELETGDAVTARKIAEELLARSDRPELHRLLGECAESAGDWREAIDQFQIAARAEESEENLFSFGSALLKANAPAEAKKIFLYAAKRYAGSARMQVGLGVAEYATGEYPQAVETLCRAVDLDPKDTRALEFLGKMSGVAPQLSGEVSSRLKHFVIVYPANAAANYYYAMSLRASANENEAAPEAAEVYLERAVDEVPTFAAAHYQLGLVKEQHGDLKAAIEQYLEAIRIEPGLRPAHYHLAQLYRKNGQSAAAEREYAIVRKLRER